MRIREAIVVDSQDLEKRLQSHALWIASQQKQGKRLDPSGDDLHGVSLPHANLIGAKLMRVNFRSANRRNVSFAGADLSGVDLDTRISSLASADEGFHSRQAEHRKFIHSARFRLTHAANPAFQFSRRDRRRATCTSLPPSTRGASAWRAPPSLPASAARPE